MIVPVAVLAVVGDQDWISALIVAETLPLIPLFMALVGAATQDRMTLQLRTLAQFPVLGVDEPGEHLDVPTSDALMADLLDTTAG